MPDYAGVIFQTLSVLYSRGDFDAYERVFSYINWEVALGFSPRFSKTDREKLKACDGRETEENGHGLYTLRTPIGRQYLDEHIVKNKGDKDINRYDFSQDTKGQNLVNDLLALAAADYKTWPRDYFSPAYILGRGFALVSVSNADKMEFCLHSEIYSISHAMQVEMQTEFLPSHYRYMPNGTIEDTEYVYTMPLFLIEQALISLRPTIKYRESLDKIATEYNGIFTGETRNKDKTVAEYEIACAHLFDKFSQTISVLKPVENNSVQNTPIATSMVKQNHQVYDVFISYRRNDGFVIANKIYSYLTSKGLRVFWDKEEMVNGHYFTSQIQQNVITTPNFLFIGTNDALDFRTETTDNPDYVAEEVRLAFQELDKDSENRIILPILPHGVSFAGKQYAEGTKALTKMDAVFLTGDEPSNKELGKILKTVTEVNRRNLWNAAHRWLYNSKLQGHRFYSLNIDKRIMPNIEQETLSVTLPIDVKMEADDKETNSSSVSLRDALSKQNKHVYLIGEGGIGKTTALISLMEEAYDNQRYTANSQIPIFVELSKAPDTYGRLYEGGTSTFIRRAIYQQLREDKYVKQINKQEIGGLDEAFMIDPDVAVEPIVSLLTKKTGSPEYLILLDGLNEISRVEIPETKKNVSTMILGEIDWMMTECPNIRIVLTSRTDEVELENANVTRLHLTGVGTKTIQEYLSAKNIPAPMIRNALHDKALLAVLRIPLFLSIYSSINLSANASSRGELLKLFFNVRKNNLDVYTAQNRISAVDNDVAKSASVLQKHRIDANMQCFLLDFIIPEIAWTMARKNSYRLPLYAIKGVENSCENLEIIIEDVLLRSTDDYGICGPIGVGVFSNYRSSSDARMHTDKIRRAILANLGDEDETSELFAKLQSLGIVLTKEQKNSAYKRGIVNIAELLLNCAVMSLGVLRSEEDTYEFAHQAFRDYFAAVKMANSFKIAYRLQKNDDSKGAREVLNSLLSESVNKDVLSLTGEYFSENKNMEPLPQDCSAVSEERKIISSLLSLYRNDFSENAKNVVGNLVNILKYSRYDLSSIDLSYLDLRACDLIGVRLSNGQYAANMVGCCLNDQNLFRPGHRGAITSVATDKNNELFATASSDGVVKVWRICDQKEILCYSEKEAPISVICFSHGNELIIGFETGDCSVLSVSTGKTAAELNFHKREILSINISSDDSRIILTSGDNTISIWEKASFKIFSVITFKPYIIVKSELDTNKDQLYIYFTDGHFEIYDYKEQYQKCIKTVENKEHCVIGGCYASEANSAIVLCKDQTLGIWTTQNQKFSGFKKIEIPNKFDLGALLTGEIVGEFNCLPNTVTCDRSGMHIAFASENQVYIMEVATGKLVNRFESATAINFLNESNLIAIGFEDGTVQICDVIKDNKIFFMKGENRLPSGKGYYLHLTSNSLILTNNHIWNQIDNMCVETLEYHGKYLNPLAVSNNGRRMVVRNEEEEYEIWDVSPVKYISTIQIMDQQEVEIFLNYEGSVLIAVSKSGMGSTVYCCDTETGIVRYSKKNNDGIFKSVAINPQGNMLAVTLFNNYSAALFAKVYDLTSGEPKFVLEGHRDDINTVQFSPDGQYIATAADDRTVRIWEANTGKCKKVLSTNVDRSKLWNMVKSGILGISSCKEEYSTWQNRAKEAFFSPDGKYVIAELGADLLVVWSTCDWKIVRTIDAGVIEDYSMDLPSQHIATVNGQSIFINSLASIDPPITFCRRSGSGNAEKIKYSLNGNKLYILYQDGIVDVWENNEGQYLNESLPDIEGPIVHGCNMTSLSPMTKLSRCNKRVLKKFGARIEMEG